MLTYLVLQFFSWLVIGGAIIFLIFRWNVISRLWKKKHQLDQESRVMIGVLLVAIIINFWASNPYPLHFAMPPMMHSNAPGEMPASIPLPNIVKFFRGMDDFEKIEDIGADPNKVPEPIIRTENATVTYNLVAKEVISEVAGGIYFNYWTYNGQVPGPMLRVKEGDDVVIELTNDRSSLHPHNIDLHAVTGPGGGAAVTKVLPGETKSFKFRALNPGLYVYHCATTNVSTHNSHGQYGMILVEPKEGLPPVDKEFYVMQGEIYTTGGIGKKGLMSFDSQALLDGNPNYITFNGRVELQPRMNIKTGDTVRMYVGNGGVNLISSFHVIGEIFDLVYPEAAVGSEPHKNIQTTAVLPGGASIVEFKAEVPGNLVLVDHALARMNKGAWAMLEVNGHENPEIFQSLPIIPLK